MKITKHDLCGQEAVLDYAALITVAEIALAKARNAIEGYIADIRNEREKTYREKSNRLRISLKADWLATEARYHQIAAETLETLIEGRDRDTITVLRQGKTELIKEDE